MFSPESKIVYLPVLVCHLLSSSSTIYHYFLLANA